MNRKSDTSHGDEAHHQADDQHDAQIKAEDIGGSQGVGSGGHHAVSGGGTDGQAAGDIAHLHVDLGGDGDADGDQDDEGDVKEHGDRQDKAGQAQTPDGLLLREGRDQFIGNDRGGAAVAHQLAQDGAEAHRKADAGHHAAKARRDRGHGGQQIQSAGHAHHQAGDDHADGGIELEHDDTDEDDGDGDYKSRDQHTRTYHSTYNSFLAYSF